MKAYIGVTDLKQYNHLKELNPDEVNFWQPGGKQSFRSLYTNCMFLFKLHSPNNYIVGGGFFVKHTFLPVSLAWEAFGVKNGTPDFFSFRKSIYKYRRSDYLTEPDPVIGCIIIAMPFFFEESDWIPVPKDWKPNIVQGKSYDTDTSIGRNLIQQVEERLKMETGNDSSFEKVSEDTKRYGASQISYPRLGQGAFRVMVTDAYHRRCAISGEKTLPVLEASHIKPFVQEGPNKTSNGLLLRRDIHTLFDRGYITVTDNYRIEVSKRIKQDYGNGRDYYAYHGEELKEIPDTIYERPSKEFLQWHNEKIYVP